MDNIRIKVDPIKWLYYETKDKAIPEVRALGDDLTSVLMESIKWIITHGGVVNIAILGEVAGSKSTTGIYLMYIINKFINKRLGRKWEDIDYFEHIFADQTEFLRFIQRDERDVGILIDEYNRLAEIGLNSMTEEHLFDHYSDVFAQKFVHRISVSPSLIADRNANIILTYLGKDPETKTSRFKLAYRETAEGRAPLVMGRVDINVGEVLNKEFYKNYREKKFKRMKLVDTYKVKDIRELEYAEIVLNTIEILNERAQCGNVKQELIVSVMEEVSKKTYGIGIYSEYVKLMVTSHAKAVLGVISDITILESRMKKLSEDGKDVTGFVKAININKTILKDRLSEWERLKQVYKEYREI